MLRIEMSKSAAGARKYFAESLQPGDYYSEDGHSPGVWFGKGAERLGLSGNVAAEDFLALAENQNPRTHERLTVRDVANRRPGYDFVFSPPKSVSALWARTGDERIVEAFRQSVLDTLAEDIEPQMRTRLRRKGQRGDTVTGELIASLFLHQTTRPVKEDGLPTLPDPHLHLHAYCFNSTWAKHEGRWQAAELGALHLDRPYLEAAFEARLAARLRGEFGLRIERNGKGSWEIADVPGSVLDKFSRRTAEIEAEARKRGITSDKEKSKLGALTRQKKGEESVGAEALRAFWNSRLTDAEAKALDAVQTGAKPAGGSNVAPGIAATRALGHAIEHFFGSDGRNSAEAESAVLEEALRYGAGSVLPADAKRELAGRALIRADIGGRTVCTTKEVLAEEEAMVAYARAGRNACEPLAARKPYVSDKGLSREQADAVSQLLGSPDRVLMLLGKSGTGKTTALRALDAALRERGRQLVAFAPTSRASRGVLRSKGFATAETVASLLKSTALQAQVRGNVLLIDEAGLGGVRALRQVFDLIEQQRQEGYDTRCLLVGDAKQHRGVPRGQVLTILQDQGGVSTPARLNTIRRQEDPSYRNAVELLSEGRAQEGFDRLDALGFVLEIPDADERYRALAKDYADTLAAGQSAMIVAPTHAEGDAVAGAARAELRARGQLGPVDHRLVRYESKGLTEAQRKDALLYQAGDTVQWSQHAPGGFKRGSRFTVVGREGERVLLQDATDQVKELPLAFADRFELYRTTSIDLAQGDRVRITRNGYTADQIPHWLNNGDVITVADFTPEGNLIDQRGWTIPAGHLAYGIITSHASQGAEAKVVYVAQSRLSRGASSAEQLYVSAGRGEKALRLYTDDKEALRLAVARSEQARSAAEVWQASQRQRQAQERVGWEFLRRRQQRRRGLWAAFRAARERAVEKLRELIDTVQGTGESRGLGHAQS
jgi:conjugative relaxase-like TrwC/TraI family protein